MSMRLHTVTACIVLLASGVWVATGKFSSVGSEIGNSDQVAVAEAPDAPDLFARPDDAVQTVAFVTAEPAGYERSIRLSGHTEADKRLTLVARTSGAISMLPATEGGSLPAGGLVMALDGPERLAAVASAEAEFDSASHQAETNQKLHASGTLPELQLEASIAAREAARAALEAARAEVDRLEVHAPFAGIIDQVFVEAGSWVQPGTEVATLLALDPIVVTGEINERDLPLVSKGTRARVTFGDGTSAEGEVRYIRRAASGPTRTFPIEVAIANPEAAIPAGMSAEIQLVAKTAPAVVLPRSVVTLDADGNLGVRSVTEAERVASLPVRIVDDTPQGLVVAGIPEGTRIIVSGQNMVSDGQRVAAVAATDQMPAEGAAD